MNGKVPRATAYYRAHRDDPEFLRQRRRYGRIYREQHDDRNPLQVVLDRACDVGCCLCGERGLEALGLYPLADPRRSLGVRQTRVKTLTVAALEAQLAECVCLCATCFTKFRAGRVGLPYWVPEDQRWWSTAGR